MTDFKLCSAAGLKTKDITTGSWNVGSCDAYIRASDVEALLANAPVVYGTNLADSGQRAGPDPQWFLSERREDEDTHTARLLLITRLKVEPEEIRLLRELVLFEEGRHDDFKRANDLKIRCAKLLQRLDGAK